MFRNSKDEMLESLDDVMRKLFVRLSEIEPDTEDYNRTLTHLERVTELRKSQQTKWRRVSPDMLLQVAGSLLGIVAIVAYEQKHVMASKATGFIHRPK